MKNIIKTVLLMLLFVMVFSLCACTSDEAKEVMNYIDSIGTVSVESKNSIDTAFNAYNRLDPKHKKQVKNIDVLYEAQKDFEEFIPEYVEKQVRYYRFRKNDKNLSYDSIKKFVEEYYEYLDDEQKSVLGCAIGKCKIEELMVP